MTVTIGELLKDAYVDGTNVLIDRKRGVESKKVLDGIYPAKPPAAVGLHTFTPDELVTLLIDPVAVNGNVTGYQRSFAAHRARRIARAMEDGAAMQLIHVALDGHGRMFIVDGQHRAAAGVMARRDVEGVIQKLDKTKQAELFFSQQFAHKIDRNTMVLAGTGQLARYIQDALVDVDHPWHGMVSTNRVSTTAFTPNAMSRLLLRYVGNAEGHGTGPALAVIEERWDEQLADELAALISAFGNKRTHPLAFKPTALQAIGATAMWVMRRGPYHPDNFDRWCSYMPTFPFDQYLHIRGQRQMTTVLVAHWNRRLPAKRRVAR